MGGDRPGGRPAERGRRLSRAFHAWARLLGIHTERFELTVPAPPEAVLDALSSASSDIRWWGCSPFDPFARRFRTHVARRRVRGGTAFWIRRGSAATGPYLYVHVEPEGGGARLRAEARPQRWAQWLAGPLVTVAALMALVSLAAVVPVGLSRGWEDGRTAIGGAAAFGLMFELGRLSLGGYGMRDRETLREWCTTVLESLR